MLSKCLPCYEFTQSRSLKPLAFQDRYGKACMKQISKYCHTVSSRICLKGSTALSDVTLIPCMPQHLREDQGCIQPKMAVLITVFGREVYCRRSVGQTPVQERAWACKLAGPLDTTMRLTCHGQHRRIQAHVSKHADRNSRKTSTATADHSFLRTLDACM